MKKFMKGCALTALILVILGVIFVFLSREFASTQKISQVVEEVTNGGMRMNLDWSDAFGITVADEFFERFGNQKGDYNMDEDIAFHRDYTISKGNVERYCPGGDIENLKVEVGACSFVTKPSQDDNYYIEVKAAEKFQGYVENHTLYIKGRGKKNFKQKDVENFVITLYVPEKATLQTVVVGVGGGNMELCGINADSGNVKVGAGSVDISDMVIGNLDVEVGMGECLAAGIIEGDVEVECAMGNVELRIIGAEEEFNYKLDGSMGQIALGDKSFSGLAQQQTIQNKADKCMEVECAMGNVSIQFTK